MDPVGPMEGCEAQALGTSASGSSAACFNIEWGHRSAPSPCGGQHFWYPGFRLRPRGSQLMAITCFYFLWLPLLSLQVPSELYVVSSWCSQPLRVLTEQAGLDMLASWGYNAIGHRFPHIGTQHWHQAVAHHGHPLTPCNL